MQSALNGRQEILNVLMYRRQDTASRADTPLYIAADWKQPAAIFMFGKL